MNIRILVCGKVEAGRTELIRKVTPKGTVPDGAEQSQSVIYETEAADYINCTLLPEVGKDYIKEINQALVLNLDPESSETCDVLWYCLSAESSLAEFNFLSKFKGRSVVVLTDCMKLDAEALENRYSELAHLGIPKEKIVTVSITDESGLSSLVNRTLLLLRKKRFDKLNLITQRWRIKESAKADSYIHWAAGRAFAIAAIPLPLADVAPLVANEAYMFYKLGSLYGYAVDQTVLTGFLGCIGASIGGKFLASFVPFLKAPIAAAMTYAIGKAAKAYFESGMELNGSDLKNVFITAQQKAKNMKWD